MSFRQSTIVATTFLAGAAALVLSAAASWAQTANPERDVALIRQDQSDCTNSTVPSSNPPDQQGIAFVVRGNNGNTSVKVAMTASPDTTYHFFLKCVRQLGDIKTDDDGIGEAIFSFATSETGATYGFDMYPEGAPSGNKFQSMTVKF